MQRRELLMLNFCIHMLTMFNDANRFRIHYKYILNIFQTLKLPQTVPTLYAHFQRVIESHNESK